jgi:hypothetical protein
MTIELDRETERLINVELGTGKYRDAGALIEAALKHYLPRGDKRQVPAGRGAAVSNAERFQALRGRIEQAGIPLLDDQQLREEIGERKGVRS